MMEHFNFLVGCHAHSHIHQCNHYLTLLVTFSEPAHTYLNKFVRAQFCQFCHSVSQSIHWFMVYFYQLILPSLA